MKTHEIEAKNLGLKVYSNESFRFPKKSTYEEIVDGVKRGKYKITYTDKRSETEIIAMMEKGKLKFEDEDLIIVPDDVFRKIRQERDRGTEGGTPKPIQGNDAHIGDEQKKEKEKRSGSPTQQPRTIQ